MALRQDFFSAEDSHAMALGSACEVLLGGNWKTWEARVIREELKFSGYTVSEINSQKLSAYICATTTIGPWADWEIFENVGQALNNNFTNFEVRQPLSVAECAVTVDCLRKARIVTFTEPVKKYIASCAAVSEFLYLPDPLTFCMPHLCPEMYYCPEHGGVEINDLSDGQCDLCSGRYEDGVLVDAPQKGLEHRGVDVQTFSLYSYAEVANKYEAIVSSGITAFSLDLNTVDMQVAKLLDVNEYRKKRMSQLNTQLQEIQNVRQ